jgi:hypothetical protein
VVSKPGIFHSPGISCPWDLCIPFSILLRKTSKVGERMCVAVHQTGQGCLIQRRMLMLLLIIMQLFACLRWQKNCVWMCTKLLHVLHVTFIFSETLGCWQAVFYVSSKLNWRLLSPIAYLCCNAINVLVSQPNASNVILWLPGPFHQDSVQSPLTVSSPSEAHAGWFGRSVQEYVTATQRWDGNQGQCCKYIWVLQSLLFISHFC